MSKHVIIKKFIVGEPIIVEGTTFESIEDIKRIVNVSVSTFETTYINRGEPIRLSRESEPREFEGWRALRIYESFPCFDSYDYADENRRFNNYILRKDEITDDFIKRCLLEIPRGSNCCMATLNAPLEFLPIIYYADGYKEILVCETENI